MNETLRNSSPPRSTERAASVIATSLFGGAILASIATASLAQTYEQTAAALAGVSVTSGYVVLRANLSSGTLGGVGGGTFMPGPSGCGAGDGGNIFPDMLQNCFYRAKPTNSVRDWGALCDVTAVTGASWDGVGTITIPALMTPPQSAPKVNQLIAISQIGTLTLWGSSTPAVSMTRFSTLSNMGSLYAPGDLVSFAGGTFSQQAAIIVDAVTNTGSTTGAISQWHFLWGGLYQTGASLPTTPMAQDNAHSYCGTMASAGTYTACGTQAAIGAMMTPTWSGWSVLDNAQVPTSPGSGYQLGERVALMPSSGSVNQGHYATIIVEGTTTTMGGVMGAVTAYDWLDYGSFETITGSTTLSQLNSSGMGTGLTFGPEPWSQAPFTSTITNVGSLGGGEYSVTLADTPPFGLSMPIEYLYYGDDDSGAINRAIQAAPSGGLVIPAGCGTTQAINLSPPANANPAQNFTTFLKGSNMMSSGLYAFAPGPSLRSSTNPVLAHVISSGTLNSSRNGFVTMPGGGLSNMFVEGLGIPQGYGYYGLFEDASTPAGYVGPTFTTSGTITNNIPSAGNLVEIDAASLMRIDKVVMNYGGIGMGNSILQCGLDESDPAHNFVTSSIANITLTDSRLDTSMGFGPIDPDFVLRLDASCHDSAFSADVFFGGTKADVLVYGGNLFSRVHLNSGAANSGLQLSPVLWPYAQTFGLAGGADYGFYVVGNTSISETQCDFANRACVFTIPNTLPGGSSNPGQITDTQMKCGNLSNTPPGYSGVELSAGTANTTVSGTSPATQCGILPFQLVKLDGPVDPSTSLCGNASAAVAGCTGYQGSLVTGRSYTQPAVTYATSTVTSTGLFAVPFVSPAVGATIQELGVYVTTAPSATKCLVGIYNAQAQSPQSLVAVGTVTATGTVTIGSTFPGSFKASLPAPGAQLAPGTLYFLAVACNGAATLEGVGATGGLSGPLVGVGASALTAIASGIVSNGWTYTSGATLPNPFLSPQSASGVWVPNVYAEP